MKKRVFTYENLEQNKLILLNLLHTFNKLLTNFSSSGSSSSSPSSHRLSEESALVITLTFPNDLSKVRIIWLIQVVWFFSNFPFLCNLYIKI
ncbi:unnamed protein product [Trichobilharzia regenti]|nr:unnamed protein product [Trichobilharzia regenti]